MQQNKESRLVGGGGRESRREGSERVGARENEGGGNREREARGEK